MQKETEWATIRLPLEFSANGVHVIRVRLDPASREWTKLVEHLDDDERRRAERFRFDEPRQQFITCRAVLRQLLGDCCRVAPRTVPLQYGKHGKPGLAFKCLEMSIPRIEFSVSHSGEYGLIAVALGFQVGIDIEEFNPGVKALNLAKRFFAPAESNALNNLPEQDQLAGFYRGWTCKEAYIKATGRGLSLPLNSFAVAIDPKQPAALQWIDNRPNEPSFWTARSIEVAPNYAAAIMASHPDCQLLFWDWTISEPSD